MSPSPILRLSVGLVGLAGCLLILIDLVFGLVPDHDAETRAYMSAAADLGARQIVEQIPTYDHSAIEHTLDEFRARNPGLVAVGVRDKSGALVASSGNFPLSSDRSSSEMADLRPVIVSIRSNQGDWGTAQFLFKSSMPESLGGWLRDRRVMIVLMTALALTLLVYFYLRRALIYLDPSTVVPERLRIAFDGLSEGVVLLDLHGRVVLANNAFRQMATVEAAKVHGRKLLDTGCLELPSDTDVPPWEAVANTGVKQVGVYVRVGPQSDRRTGRLNCSPIGDARGKVRGCLVTIADMTAIETANIELKAALHELQLTRVTARMSERIRLRQAERERIAGDLHDTLLQGIYGLLLKVQSAVNGLPAEMKVRRDLEWAVDRADKLVNEGRDRVAGLRGTGADFQSLKEAIESAVTELVHENSVRFQVLVKGEPMELHAEVHDELYYIAREAMQNALDHSGAENIQITLEFTASEFRMTIADDGRGIEEKHLKASHIPGHWGITGMRERARRIGGTLQIASGADGTTVEVLIAASAAYSA